MWEAASLPLCLSLTGIMEQRGFMEEPVFLGQHTNIHQSSAAGNLCGMVEPLETITPHCVALQVFYYFNDRQRIAREQTRASFLYIHVDMQRQPLFIRMYGVFSLVC